MAMAPVCSSCGVVIVGLGGTFGLVGAYGVNDANFTKDRVEADLGVFREYQERYKGMKLAGLQQIDWSPERYVTLPTMPALLEVATVPSFAATASSAVKYALVWIVLSFIVGGWGLGFILYVVDSLFRLPFWLQKHYNFISALIWVCGGLVAFGVPFYRRLLLQIRNGSHPRENAKRLMEYEKARAAALRHGSALKAAEDHRIRQRVAELDALAATLSKKEESVRELLRKL